MNDEPENEERLLRVDEVARMLGVSKSQVYRLQDSGSIPRSVSVGPRATRWRLSDIRRYIDQL